MVGYVIGLGDRHLVNILLDGTRRVFPPNEPCCPLACVRSPATLCSPAVFPAFILQLLALLFPLHSSAEVVHIDMGVAFEQVRLSRCARMALLPAAAWELRAANIQWPSSPTFPFLRRLFFSQGTLLMTPETVPFRLNRDMVDGMGVLGVEGVFRRCSQETLAVLRSYSAAILTIVEASSTVFRRGRDFFLCCILIPPL